MLSLTLKRLRRATIAAIDRLGLRSTAAELRGRWSPSYASRRDHQDMMRLRTIVATVLGGGGRGVDVGANIGVVSQMFFDVAPGRPHVLVEPVAELASGLEEKFPAALVVDAVCSSKSGDVQFNVAVDQPTRSSVHADMARSGGRIESRELRSVRLDDVVGSDPVALVKIDVEGNELAVLRGATSVLSEQRPVIVFEHTHVDGQSPSPSPMVFELFAELRYRLFDIDGAPMADANQFEEVVRGGRMWTFLAVPTGPDGP